MVKYIASLSGVRDPKMKDGTTAFAIALARKDVKVLKTLMDAKLPSDIDHQLLARRAIMEMDRNSHGGEYLRGEVHLTNVLMRGLVFRVNERTPRQKISVE